VTNIREVPDASGGAQAHASAMMKPNTPPVLIIGSTGKSGRRVDALLQWRGIVTRPVSRSTPLSFDWSRPDGWARALDGVAKAYVALQPDLAMEGAAAAIAELSHLARKYGLERLVLLSARRDPGAHLAEAVLQESGVPWTSVRASWFNQNFSEGFLLDCVLAGEIALPSGAIREPFVDVDDIAEVVVAALTDERHVNRRYEITGPRELTIAEAAAEISAGIGRPVRFTQISPDDFVISLRAYAPEPAVQRMHKQFTAALDSRSTAVTQDIYETLGRPARNFSNYVRRAAASGVWNA
jgi:uncharacterized protein YbjT (DUF2867 family)